MSEKSPVRPEVKEPEGTGRPDLRDTTSDDVCATGLIAAGAAVVFGSLAVVQTRALRQESPTVSSNDNCLVIHMQLFAASLALLRAIGAPVCFIFAVVWADAAGLAAMVV